MSRWLCFRSLRLCLRRTHCLWLSLRLWRPRRRSFRWPTLWWLRFQRLLLLRISRSLFLLRLIAPLLALRLHLLLHGRALLLL